MRKLLKKNLKIENLITITADGVITLPEGCNTIYDALFAFDCKRNLELGEQREIERQAESRRQYEQAILIVEKNRKRRKEKTKKKK